MYRDFPHKRKRTFREKVKDQFEQKRLKKHLYLITACLGALSWYYMGNAWYGVIIGLGLIITNILRVDPLF